MIDVLVDDLAFAIGEAIAWPVTARLGATTPLLRRLEAAGGPMLAAQLSIQEPLPVGAAVVTGAGALQVQWLVNAVVASDSEQVSESGVRRALTSALQRAADWQIEHLLIAPFGLGAGNLALETSAGITADVITQHRGRARHPVRVTIVVESALEQEAFHASAARVIS
jgi:O-acetyl-ADP-ribose deacetylase (regulator of RNase III)